MPGKPVLIGPFVKGLNNISQAGESDDTEVVNLINFEVALDKSLTARPPMQVVDGSLLGATNTEGWTILGIYRVSLTEWYVIAQKMTSPGNWSLVAILNGDPTSTVITIKTMTSAANKVTGYAQWQQTCYFCVGNGASIAGFSWVKGGSATDITAMPKGSIMVAHKTRLWICDTTSATNANTIWFSTVDTTGSHPDVWASTDNIVVDPGSGGFITCMLPLNNSLIIFKSDATYRFSYPTAPKNGQVDTLSTYIGTANQFSAVNFENYVYIYHQGRVYELINNIFIQINKLVQFALDGDNACVDSSAPTVNMSVVTRRIVIQYNNTLYSFHVDTKTWGQWRSYNGTPGRFIELPADPASANPNVYISASQGLIQNPSTNYITDPAFYTSIPYIQSNIGTGYNVSSNAGVLSVSKADNTAGSQLTVYLNNIGNNLGYNIALSPGQRFKFQGTVTSSVGTVNARMTYLLSTGGITTTDIVITGTFTALFTAPAQAIQGYLTVWSNTLVNIGDTVTLTNVSINRTNDTSPFTLIKITDRHIVSSQTIEYMECMVRTKSYDYQAPSVDKRLFWWGIDGKTTMDVTTKTIPIAKQLPILWGDLQNYTHAQLAAGTWGNPLSFLTASLTVIDTDALANSATENGRIFAKNLKSLRFRQLSFQINMTCLGNTVTGPCKVFSITSYALPKEKADAKVS